MDKRVDNVLADGEVTGHSHRVIGDEVAVYEDRSFVAPEGARVVHEEHADFVVDSGSYDTGIVREMDHFEKQAKEVAD